MQPFLRSTDMIGIIASQRSMPSFWSKTLALLHFEGPNSSTTFVDEKGTSWVSTSGAPYIDHSQFKFGSSSGYFNGTAIEPTGRPSDYWVLGTDDFTIECFIRCIDLGTGIYYDSVLGNWVANVGWCFFIRPDGSLDFRLNNSFLLSSAGIITNNTWIHIAACRTNGTTRLFVNGTMVASTTTVYNLSATAVPRIGTNRVTTTADFFEGWIDEVLITKTSLYTSNFTPRTKAIIVA